MIRISNLQKEYKRGKVVALKNINIKIGRGSLTAVVGRNGAGKSTLFKIMGGIITEYSGECLVDGKNTNIEFSQKFSYLPEVRGLDGRMIVLEHLTDIICYKGIKRKVAQESVRYWLNEFGISNFENRRIDTLSKGNQQKLQFITAIATNPEVLILDEPFSGLDYITTEIFWTIIKKLHNDGCTIMLSTHILSNELIACDKFLFLVNGEVKEFGTLDDIQNKYNKILEIKCNSANESLFYDFVPKEHIHKFEDTYYIDIFNEKDAKAIFLKLDKHYCEKFYIRKISITELFKKLNKEKNIYE